jgi:hypothetical protein
MVTSDRYHGVQVKKMNPMGEGPNKGVNRTTILFLFFFYFYRVILRPKEYYRYEWPKLLNEKNYVGILQP